MPATPDHRAQIAYRDVEVNISSTGSSTVCSSQGAMRYNGSGFQFLDSVGQYDPRWQAIIAHAMLYDMPHVLHCNGPTLNNAYKTVTYYAATFINTETWWVNSNQTAMLSQHKYTYTGTNYTSPATEAWILYDGTTGNNVLHRITDTIGYIGVNEVSRQRTYQ